MLVGIQPSTVLPEHYSLVILQSLPPESLVPYFDSVGTNVCNIVVRTTFA